MKRNKANILIFFMLLIISQGSVSVSVSAATLKLNKSKVTIAAGSTFKLNATVKGSKKKVKWTSSNKSIATINSKGIINAKKTGKVTIKAKCGKLKKTCRVTVKATNKSTIAKYKAAIKALSWPTAVFAVYDIDGNGTYEAIVEDIAYNGTNFHPDRKGKILFSYKGAIKSYDYGPSIETFGAINSKRQLFFDRTKGKAIITIRSFSPSQGVKDITAWFGPYLSDNEVKNLEKKYLSGLQYPIFVKATSTNLDKYLSGNGKATGYSTKWISKGFSNNG